MMSSELGVEPEKFKKATRKKHAFLYVDKPKKEFKRNSLQNYKCIILE